MNRRRHRKQSLLHRPDGFRRPVEVLDDELALRAVDSPVDVFQNQLPGSRLASVGAFLRRLFKIDASDHEALRQFHLQFAQAGAADGSAKAGYCRFTYASAARKFSIGRMHREIHVGQHGFGHAALGWPQTGRGLLDD